MANFRKIGTDFTNGLRAPHYTNGRLLTAEDLQQGQQTQLEKQAQLGQAAGYGIVTGFNVSAAANNSALSVTAGSGVNRNGNVIQLTAGKITLPISPISDDQTAIRRSGRFEACDGDEGEPITTITAGAYLLTAAPLAQLEGAVPRKACDGTSTATCANQWEVEGVEFKIVRLTGYTPPTGNRAHRNRNLLAHWFYGSDQLINLMRDPLKFPANYSGFSQIPAADFNECDLPLAIFYWASNQIQFVDEWAVRRRLVHAYPAAKWSANLSDQRQAEGHARFLQFQEHIDALQTSFGNQTDTIRAVDRFAYLPPVGMLPVNPFELIVADVFDDLLSDSQEAEIAERGLTQTQVLEQVRTSVLNSLGNANSYNLERFFGDMLSSQYTIVHEDFVHDRLHQSWVQPPIILPPPPNSPNFFQFALADGTLLAVDNSNFDNVLQSINKNFSGTVFTAKTVEVADPTAGSVGSIGTRGTITERTTVDTAEPVVRSSAVTDNVLLNAKLLNQFSVFRPPLEIFIPPQSDDEEVEPLIDILVVDELLDPYRNQLASQMTGRINDAITTLSTPGGVFTGINQFKAINNSIANAFTLNTFLWQASNFGIVNFSKLSNLIRKANVPTFYVVFVRHRPPARSRPLRL